MKKIRRKKATPAITEFVGTRELETQIQEALVQKDEVKAVQLLRTLVTRDVKNFGAHQQLVNILSDNGLMDLAVQHCDEQIKRFPDLAFFHYLRGAIFAPTGKSEEAMESLDRALELNPDLVQAKIKRASVLERTTRYDEAKEAVDDLIKAGVKDPELDLVLGTIALHNKEFEEAVEFTEPYVFNGRLNPGTRIHAGYTCGKAHDKLGNADKAMAALKVANTVAKKPFDRELVLSQVNQLKNYFTPEVVAGLTRSTNQFASPVFVAAMPRSGTTLLDQIMDAHPDAYGAGEIDNLDYFRFNIPDITGSKKQYPASIQDLTVDHLNRFAKNYINYLKQVSDGKERVVNKNLENYKNVPLMYMAFPNAKVIHIRRRAVDCALSIYMNGFNLDAYSYTSELKDIGFIWRQHERLMEHWLKVLPMDILNIRYEELVDNPEETTRKIIEFIGLPWDDACLSFYKNKRTVMTPSYHQVAQPIYKSSVGQADKYKDYLHELIEEIEMEYPEDNE